MEEYEVDLRDYLRVIWRKKWIILITFLIALVAAALVSWGTPSRYAANALYQLRVISAASGAAFSPPSTETAVAMLSSRALLQEAGRGLIPAGSPSSPLLKVTSREDSLLEIELQGTLSPDRLAEVLSQLVLLFSQRVKEQIQADTQEKLLGIERRAALLEAEQARLGQEIDELLRREGSAELKVGELDATLEGWALRFELSNLYAQLTPIREELGTLRLSQQELSELLATDWEPLRAISAPSASTTPLGPSWTMNLAVAGVLGLFIGVLLAFFVHYMEGGRKDETAGE